STPVDLNEHPYLIRQEPTTTAIYPLSLHDALPISRSRARHPVDQLLLPHPPDRRAGQSHRPRIRSPLTPWGARQLGSTIALRGGSILFIVSGCTPDRSLSR